MHDIFEVPISVPSNVYQGAHETEHSDHWLKGLQDSDNQRSHHWHHSEFKHYPKAPAQVDTKKRPPSLWVVSVSNTGHETALVQFFPGSMCRPCVQHDPCHSDTGTSAGCFQPPEPLPEDS